MTMPTDWLTNWGALHGFAALSDFVEEDQRAAAAVERDDGQGPFGLGMAGTPLADEPEAGKHVAASTGRTRSGAVVVGDRQVTWRARLAPALAAPRLSVSLGTIADAATAD